MKSITFLILCLTISASMMAQYTSKDKIFKAISKSNVALFKSEVDRLESIENSLDSVYLIDYTFDKNNEKIVESFNIVEEAIRNGSIDIVKALFEIKHKFPNFQWDLEGIYPLLISFNEIDKLRYILNQGINVNVKCKVCYDQSPLLIAVTYENYPLAIELLDKGADPSFVNFKGFSVLMGVVSADTFSVELFDRIVNEKQAALSVADKAGMTALSYALYNSNIYASKKLIAEGATFIDKDQVGLIASGNTQIFRQFKDEKWLSENLNSWRYYEHEDDLEYSIMDYAILSENPKMVKLLIVDYGLDTNPFEDIYDNALYIAIDTGTEEMVQVLLEYGDNKDVNKHFLKRAKKRKFSDETLEEIEALIAG
jgi:ankyrin repeat protein